MYSNSKVDYSFHVPFINATFLMSFLIIFIFLMRQNQVVADFDSKGFVWFRFLIELYFSFSWFPQLEVQSLNHFLILSCIRKKFLVLNVALLKNFLDQDLGKLVLTCLLSVLQLHCLCLSFKKNLKSLTLLPFYVNFFSKYLLIKI